MKQNRRQSRENAFLLLFEWSFHAGSPDETLRRAEEGRALEADRFCRELITRAIEGVIGLDNLIASYSDSYKLERLSKVTLAVLRVAFCEMTLMDDIPLGATINEAVELCKKYAGDEEAAYVNGILGQYGRDRDAGTMRVMEHDARDTEHGLTQTPKVGADRAKALEAYHDKKKAAEVRTAKRKSRSDRPHKPKTERDKPEEGRPYQAKANQGKSEERRLYKRKSDENEPYKLKAEQRKPNKPSPYRRKAADVSGRGTSLTDSTQRAKAESAPLKAGRDALRRK